MLEPPGHRLESIQSGNEARNEYEYEQKNCILPSKSPLQTGKLIFLSQLQNTFGELRTLLLLNKFAIAITMLRVPKEHFLLEKRRAYHRGKKAWYFALLAREVTVAVIYDQWKNLKHPWQIRDPVRLTPQRFLYRGPRFRHRP